MEQSSGLTVRRADPARNSKGCTPMGCKEGIRGLGHEEVLMASLLWSSTRKSRKIFTSPLKISPFDVFLAGNYNGPDCVAVFSPHRTLSMGCKRNPIPRVCLGYLMRNLSVRGFKTLELCG